jgi:hypothetical protein
LDAIVVKNALDFPKPSDIPINPLGRPNRFRTSVSFIAIVAVAERPSSTLTCDKDKDPDDGNAIPLFINIYQ